MPNDGDQLFCASSLLLNKVLHRNFSEGSLQNTCSAVVWPVQIAQCTNIVLCIVYYSIGESKVVRFLWCSYDVHVQ